MNVSCIKNGSYQNNIEPDFIYNRFDIYKDEYYVLNCIYNGVSYHVEFYIDNQTAILGLWLMNIPTEVIKQFIAYIFNNFNLLTKIKYSNGPVPLGLSWKSVHYKIYLPTTEEELHKRLSKKGRYNIKRERDIIERELGPYTLNEYITSQCPSEIIESYFRFKLDTHHTDYKLSPTEYLNKFHVTHIYALSTSKSVLAVLLSCEQCENIYLENLSYDMKYQHYSCGKALYDMYLVRLIEKGRKSVFLAGGDLDYKKRYGSTKDETYECIIYKNKVVEKLLIILLSLKHYIKKILIK